MERLEHVASTPFKRVSYTEAVEILVKAVREKKKKFENSKVTLSPWFSTALRRLNTIKPSGCSLHLLPCIVASTGDP